MTTGHKVESISPAQRHNPVDVGRPGSTAVTGLGRTTDQKVGGSNPSERGKSPSHGLADQGLILGAAKLGTQLGTGPSALLVPHKGSCVSTRRPGPGVLGRVENRTKLRAGHAEALGTRANGAMLSARLEPPRWEPLGSGSPRYGMGHHRVFRPPGRPADKAPRRGSGHRASATVDAAFRAGLMHVEHDPLRQTAGGRTGQI